MVPTTTKDQSVWPPPPLGSKKYRSLRRSPPGTPRDPPVELLVLLIIEACEAESRGTFPAVKHDVPMSDHKNDHHNHDFF